VAKNKLCEAPGSNSGVIEDSDLLDVTPCGRFSVSYDPQPASGEASRKNTNSPKRPEPPTERQSITSQNTIIQ
jgi:hypothetical protein